MKLFAAVPTNIASVKEAILNADVKVVLFTTEVEAMEMALECGRRDFHIVACEFDSDKVASSSFYTDAITRAQSDELISYLKKHYCEKIPSSLEGHFAVCALSQFLAAAKTNQFGIKTCDADLERATSYFCKVVGYDAVYANSDCTRVEVLDRKLIHSLNGLAQYLCGAGDALPEYDAVCTYVPVEVNNAKNGVRGFYYTTVRNLQSLRDAFGSVPSILDPILACRTYLRSSGSNEEECNYQIRYVDGSIAMSPALPWQLYVEGNRDSKPLSDYMAWEDDDFVRIASIVDQYDDGDGEVVFTKVYDREEDMPKLDECKDLFEHRPAIQVSEESWGFRPAFERQISVNYLDDSKRNAKECKLLRRLEEAQKSAEEDSASSCLVDDDDIPF